MELEVDAKLGVELATKADIEALIRKMGEPPYINKVFRPFSQSTDVNGNLTERVYDVEDGKIFSASMIILWADGFTPAVPYSNPATWVGIFHGNQPAAANLADFAPLSPNGQVFPSVWKYGLHDSPEWKAPDNVTLGVFSGPVSTNITCLLFGELRSVKIGVRSINVERGTKNGKHLPRGMNI